MTVQCPAVADLQLSDDSAVAQHFATCPRCRALEPNRSSARAVHAPSAVKAPPHWSTNAPDLELGQLLRARNWGSDEYLLCVVIAIEDGLLDVIPLSEDVSAAAEQDVVLGPDPLGYLVMAETWNAGTLLVEQLVDVLGNVDDQQWARLTEVLDEGEREQTGPPVVCDEDPRIGSQVLESERAREFYRPALSLRGIHSLPAFVNRRANELQIDPQGLNEELGHLLPEHPTWVIDLSEDNVDLDAVVEDEALGALLDRLEAQPTRRLAAIIESSYGECRGAGDAVASHGAELEFMLMDHSHESEGKVHDPAGWDYACRVMEILARRRRAPE